MIYLFIHQNFPGQYKHLALHLAQQPGNDVYFITQSKQRWLPGVVKLVYQISGAVSRTHPLLGEMDTAVQHGLAVLQVCQQLLARRVRPDIILGHNGWGETLFVKDVFPDAPLLSYFEFFYHANGLDVGFDPSQPTSLVSDCRIRLKNTVNLLGLEATDWGNTPTRWQHSLYPPEHRQRISIVHEGIDTQLACPAPDASIHLQREGLALTRRDEVITYVARNLEPYRGFPQFMRAAAILLQRRPRAHVVIVGGDGVSYGDPAPDGKSYRRMMMEELGDNIDQSRLHFLGAIAYSEYLSVLRVSSAHVYLTFPFVLSWSLLEAFACACPVVGSNTPPVLEVLEPGLNGLAADFFSPEDIATNVERLLEDRPYAARLGSAARATVLARYGLSDALSSWEKLISTLMRGEKPTILENFTPRAGVR